MYYYHIKQGNLVSDKVSKEISNPLSTKIVNQNNDTANVTKWKMTWREKRSVWAGITREDLIQELMQNYRKEENHGGRGGGEMRSRMECLT